MPAHHPPPASRRAQSSRMPTFSSSGVLPVIMSPSRASLCHACHWPLVMQISYASPQASESALSALSSSTAKGSGMSHSPSVIGFVPFFGAPLPKRSEEHTSELQSRQYL